MNRWEYTIVRLAFSGRGYAGTQAELTALGKDGWEAVAVWDNAGIPYVLLKRPFQEQ